MLSSATQTVQLSLLSQQRCTVDDASADVSGQSPAQSTTSTSGHSIHQCAHRQGCPHCMSVLVKASQRAARRKRIRRYR